MLIDILIPLREATDKLKNPKINLKEKAFYQQQIKVMQSRLKSYGTLKFPKKLFECWGKSKSGIQYKIYLVVDNENELKPLIQLELKDDLAELNTREIRLKENYSY